MCSFPGISLLQYLKLTSGELLKNKHDRMGCAFFHKLSYYKTAEDVNVPSISLKTKRY